MRDLDSLQHRFNAFVHLAQGLADVAANALVALSARRDAGGDEQRAINRLDDLKGGNRMSGTGERVSAIGPVLRLQ